MQRIGSNEELYEDAITVGDSLREERAAREFTRRRDAEDIRRRAEANEAFRALSAEEAAVQIGNYCPLCAMLILPYRASFKLPWLKEPRGMWLFPSTHAGCPGHPNGNGEHVQSQPEISEQPMIDWDELKATSWMTRNDGLNLDD